jgi:EmrB/QacA subfamily drug resistance transporter
VQHNKFLVAFVAALGILMAVLDNTIVNVALVPMADDFDTNYSVIQWVITAFFLSQAAVIPIAGYLGHRYGMKRSFLVSVGLFTLSSLLCGLATSAEQLILFRVLQGIGGGALFPLAQAIATAAFPIHERQKGSMIIGVSVLLGPIFGPTLGGWLIDLYHWPAIFTINLPLGALTLVLAYVSFPDDVKSQASAGVRFDWIGLGLSVIASVMLVYAFALVAEVKPGTESAMNPRGELYGWNHWAVWALLGGGIALMISFVIYELRHADPVLDVGVMRNPTFTAPSALLWLIAMVIFGSILLIPVFFEQIRIEPLSAMDTGLALMPQGIGAAVATVFAARLYYKLGVRTLVVFGIALLALSGYMLTNFEVDSNGKDVLLALSIRGIGFGFTFIPLQTLALQMFMGASLAKASSLLNVGRQIFASVGVSVIITLFTQLVTSNVKAAMLLRPEAVEGLRPSLPEMEKRMSAVVADAGTSAVNEVMMILFFATMAMILLVPLLPSKKKLVAMFKHHPGPGASATE